MASVPDECIFSLSQSLSNENPKASTEERSASPIDSNELITSDSHVLQQPSVSRNVSVHMTSPPSTPLDFVDYYSEKQHRQIEVLRQQKQLYHSLMEDELMTRGHVDDGVTLDDEEGQIGSTQNNMHEQPTQSGRVDADVSRHDCSGGVDDDDDDDDDADESESVTPTTTTPTTTAPTATVSRIPPPPLLPLLPLGPLSQATPSSSSSSSSLSLWSKSIRSVRSVLNSTGLVSHTHNLLNHVSQHNLHSADTDVWLAGYRYPFSLPHQQAWAEVGVQRDEILAFVGSLRERQQQCHATKTELMGFIREFVCGSKAGVADADVVVANTTLSLSSPVSCLSFPPLPIPTCGNGTILASPNDGRSQSQSYIATGAPNLNTEDHFNPTHSYTHTHGARQGCSNSQHHHARISEQMTSALAVCVYGNTSSDSAYYVRDLHLLYGHSRMHTLFPLTQQLTAFYDVVMQWLGIVSVEVDKEERAVHRINTWLQQQQLELQPQLQQQQPRLDSPLTPTHPVVLSAVSDPPRVVSSQCVSSLITPPLPLLSKSFLRSLASQLSSLSTILANSQSSAVALHLAGLVWCSYRRHSAVMVDVGYRTLRTIVSAVLEHREHELPTHTRDLHVVDRPILALYQDLSVLADNPALLSLLSSRITLTTTHTHAKPRSSGLGVSGSRSNTNTLRFLPCPLPPSLATLLPMIKTATALSLTSDKGWGCMVRSGQMMLANVLMRHYSWNGYKCIYSKHSECGCYDATVNAHPLSPRLSLHRSVLSLFADTPSASFSLHALLTHKASDRKIGEWFGPLEVSLMIERACEAQRRQGVVDRDRHRHTQSSRASCADVAMCATVESLRVHVARDGCVFLSDLLGLFDCDNVYHDGSHAPHCRCDTQRPGPPTGVLLVVPLCLGLDAIPPSCYQPLLLSLSLAASAGIIGGFPRSSMYFYGRQGEELLYLDPHTTQDAVRVSDVCGCTPVADEPHTHRHDDHTHTHPSSAVDQTTSYIPNGLLSSHVSHLDPSLALCFYLPSPTHAREWYTQMKRLCAGGVDALTVSLFETATSAVDDVTIKTTYAEQQRQLQQLQQQQERLKLTTNMNTASNGLVSLDEWRPSWMGPTAASLDGYFDDVLDNDDHDEDDEDFAIISRGGSQSHPVEYQHTQHRSSMSQGSEDFVDVTHTDTRNTKQSLQFDEGDVLDFE